MKMRKFLSCNLISLIVGLPLCATSALAAKLPKGAVPLTEAEVSALYSNHTAVWAPNAMAYFAEDGTVKGIFPDTAKPGNWTAKNNEFCMNIQGVDAKAKKLDGKTYSDCWQWFKDSKGKFWALYSKKWDNSKVDPTNFNKDEYGHLKAGDLVSAKYIAPLP
jgi:Protein of unknown function (DUF995)